MPRVVLGSMDRSGRLVVGRVHPETASGVAVGMVGVSTTSTYPIGGEMYRATRKWLYDSPQEYGMTPQEAERDWDQIERRVQRFYTPSGGYGDDIGWKSGSFGHGFNFQYPL